MARLLEIVSDNLLNCWKTLRGNQQRSLVEILGTFNDHRTLGYQALTASRVESSDSKQGIPYQVVLKVVIWSILHGNLQQ